MLNGGAEMDLEARHGATRGLILKDMHLEGLFKRGWE